MLRQAQDRRVGPWAVTPGRLYDGVVVAFWCSSHGCPSPEAGGSEPTEGLRVLGPLSSSPPMEGVGGSWPPSPSPPSLALLLDELLALPEDELDAPDEADAELVAEEAAPALSLSAEASSSTGESGALR